MSHGKRAAIKGHQTREYWSRRLGRHGMQWGRVSKRLTHRLERRTAKRQAKEAT